MFVFDLLQFNVENDRNVISLTISVHSVAVDNLCEIGITSFGTIVFLACYGIV